MFFKISVLKNFEKFTGKHLYWSHFLNKVVGFLIEHLRVAAFKYSIPKPDKHLLLTQKPKKKNVFRNILGNVKISDLNVT